MLNRPLKTIILSGLRYLVQISIIVFVCILLKITCVEVVYIPSGSMEDAIYTGDYIVVNKLCYGARLPRDLSEIPWLNIFSVLCNHRYSPDYQKNSRIKGFSSIKRNDVLVFNQPMTPEVLFIKRCVGLPGDSVLYNDTSIFINNRLLKDPPQVKYNYYVKFKAGVNISKAKSVFGLNYREDWFERKNPIKTINMPVYKYDLLRKSNYISSIYRCGNINADLTSNNKIISANTKCKIPYKGFDIELNHSTINDYGKLIQSYEKMQFDSISNNFYYKAGIKITHYTFKYNYYFMLGDNRDNSIDSRYWGLVPDYFVVGKAGFVIKPGNSLEFKRYFRNI